MIQNFDKLKIDCDDYNKNYKKIESNYGYEFDLYNVWGYTPFETIKSILLLVEKPKRIIIYGCSIGYQCFFIKQIFPDLLIIGIDLCQPRVDWGLNKIKEYSITGVDLICDDIVNFQIQDGDLIWQNDLLFDDDFTYDLTSYNLSNFDISVISYKSIFSFIDDDFINLSDQTLVDSEGKFIYIDLTESPNYITSWSNDQRFFIYKRSKKSNFYGVDYISPEFIIDEKSLSDYDSMNYSKRLVKSSILKSLYNKKNLKLKFQEFGFNVPKTYFYSSKKVDIVSVLENLETFVAKPAHFSESIDVFIKKEKTKLDLEIINKKLNDRLEISDKFNWRRNKVNFEIDWKNTEPGILIEQYINVVYELKVFVVFGEPLIADLRTGFSELYNIDYISKNNKYLNWDKEYDMVINFSKYLKIDFFRIDFLYDGSKLWASEVAFMPGTYLPPNISEIIAKKIRSEYFKYYYPNLC
jgi:hypothetical protein